MRMVARLLLIIPLGLILAFGAGGLFLMVATVASQPLSQMVFAGLDAFSDVVFGMAFNGEDPTGLAVAASWQGFKLVAAILIAPVVITAVASELFRVGSGLIQMVLCGILATALPAAVLGLRRMPVGTETQVLAAFFLTGVATGAIYWMVAGRGARYPDPRLVSGPPASTGS